MAVIQIIPGVYQIGLQIVNAFLVEFDELTLIDTGTSSSADKILQAVEDVRRQPKDIQNILVTHLHGDHTGSLAALKDLTGAQAYMHPLDADLVRKGQTMRPVKPAPGVVNNLLYRLMSLQGSGGMSIQPTKIEVDLIDGDELDFAGGMHVIHAPGHSAGQVVFLLPNNDGLLFAADAATNMFGLGHPPIYEDFDEGQKTLSRLAALDFESACFGHGKAIVDQASERFRQKWSAVQHKPR